MILVALHMFYQGLTIQVMYLKSFKVWIYTGIMFYYRTSISLKTYLWQSNIALIYGSSRYGFIEKLNVKFSKLDHPSWAVNVFANLILLYEKTSSCMQMTIHITFWHNMAWSMLFTWSHWQYLENSFIFVL